MKNIRQPVIISLVNKLPPQLENYFLSINAKIIKQEEADNYNQVDIIIVDTSEKVKEVYSHYLVVKNDIRILCLSQPRDVKDFLLHNGRLSITTAFLENPISTFILNKYFTEKMNIHLDENLQGVLKEYKNFKIFNHLNVGFYADQLSLDAFDVGFNIVTIRSFLDHAVYYFSYLKQAALGGAPFEVEYGWNDQVFTLSMHLSVKNFVAEYLIDSFGSINANDPIQSLLTVMNKSCEYFDVSYVSDSGKLVICAYWSKANLKNQGFVFANILTSAQTVMSLERKIENYTEPTLEKIEEKKIEKETILENKPLPGGIVELVVSQNTESLFAKAPEKGASLLAFAIEIIHEKFPDIPMSELTLEDIKTVVGGFPDEEVVSIISSTDQEELLDKLNKQNVTQAYQEEIERVRGNLEEDDNFKQTLSSSLNEEVAQRVTGGLDAELINRILGTKDGKEETQVVKGSKEEEDKFSQTIKGNKEKADNFKQTISSIKEEKDNFIAKISSSFEENVKGGFNVKIGSGGTQEEKGKCRQLISGVTNAMEKEVGFNLETKNYIKEKAPELLEQGLNRYAQKIGQTLETLSESQLIEFKNIELPKTLNELINNDKHISEFENIIINSTQTANLNSFDLNLKKNLEAKLANNDKIQKENDKFVITSNDVENHDVKTVIHSAIKETLDQEFKLIKGTKEEIEQKESEIIHTLSKTLNEPEENVRILVKGAAEKVKEEETKLVVNNLFQNQNSEVPAPAPFQMNSPQVVEKIVEKIVEKEVIKEVVKEAPKQTNVNEALLINKLKESDKLKTRLEKEVELLKLQLKTQAESHAKASEVKEKVNQAVAEKLKTEEVKEELKVAISTIPESPIKEEKRSQLVEELKAGKKLSEEDAKALAVALEREQQVIELAKSAELNLKKLQIESNQREAIFKQELTKSERALKGKELVLEKAKDSMKVLMTKKEGEIVELKKTVEDLNKKLNLDLQKTQENQIKELGKTNENLSRNLEMYKTKIQTMIEKMEEVKEAAAQDKSAEDGRQLAKVNIQLENKLNAELKIKKTLEERLKKAIENEASMRNTKMKTDSMLKEAQLIAKQQQEQLARASVGQVKVEADLEQKYKIQMRQFEEKAKLSESKIRDLEEKLKALNINQAQAAAGAQMQAEGSAKEKQLDAANKKLQADNNEVRTQLNDAKKEAVKYKAEVTAMKNKLSVMEKELEKFKKKKAA
jgi:hypothetical protein